MILNRQRAVRVARRPLELFLRRLQEHLGLGAADVTICLVSDAEIARMNEVFRKKNGPTDVLSFPAVARRKPVTLPIAPHGFRQGSVPAVQKRSGNSRALGPEVKVVHRRKLELRGTSFLGDIAISPATARRNAKQYGLTLPSELQILMLHGVLHLLGFDHESDHGQMQRVEQRLRRRLGLA